MSKESFLREFINEVWNKKNFKKIEKYIHNEYTIHLDPDDPWERKTLSHSEFRNRMELGSFKPFPDMKFDITSAIEDENHVAITWILTGTNLGQIGEHPPTKKPINAKGMTIYHFKGHLINGHTQIFDRKSVMKQLGFI
ncbi:ester cyclase [Flavivirga sp. 57AJ16]|uniref:ester cyclase n=1 Tax=Flavivirga sp. 57AJ16 TaxID=3025307 RepID=UPI00236541AD|nr:ester cyclase [Flavivirga sp. 57AJ16]MDD7885475.1 ester cyclase [Flavivirga sp. 57AJ16]